MTVVALFLACFIFGCASSVEKITDIERFKQMTAQTDRIDVDFDNYTGKSFEFSITDKTQIEEIMDMVLNTPLKDMGTDSPFDGGHTSITIVQGEKEFTLNINVFKGGKHFYSFTVKDLQTKIRQLATEVGAFNGVV